MRVIGLDIGGTELKGGMVTSKGECLGSLRIPTPHDEGNKGVLKAIHTLINRLNEQYGPYDGIGVATAGRVNIHTGVVVYATENLPGWKNLRLKQDLERVHHVPVMVDNDVNAGLVGELWNPPEEYGDSVVMLTLGTGVGGAASIGGKLVRGRNWNGNEWGHVVLVPGGRECNCGQRGCIEQYLSGTALLRAINEKESRNITHGSDVFKHFTEGNAVARLVVEEFLEYLAIVISNISVIYDPDSIIIGGGMIHSKDFWWANLIDLLREKGIQNEIYPAHFGNHAGVRGAGKLIVDYLEGVHMNEA
ncbi:MAG TPA: ROK family protein [Bacillales bacterium]|nr:ROK family protein [Bacillales bacterium]